MATVQAPAGKPIPPIPARHEALVDGQLDRAVGRIRRFDILAALLGLAAGTLAFGLTLMLLDVWLNLPMIARLAMFGGYVLAASAYLVVSLIIPLTRPINPHYAAVRLETTLPGAKNSLVNYLDLREKALPSAIKGAVGAKAARDVAQTRIDQAIRSRPVLWLSLLTGLLSVAMLIMLAVMGPAMFFALLGRNFYAFGSPQVTRTQITLLEPASGDATVPVGLPVNFVVRLSGKVPAASAPDHARLLFKYSQNEQLWQERPLGPGDLSDQWTYRLPGNEVNNGFYYRIVAGDAATPEHYIQARSGPLVTGFDVLYTHRPYLRKPQETSKDANLIGWRGTEVTLVAHTNRTVQTGRLIFDGTGRDAIVSEPIADLPNAMRFRLVLDKEGTYRVRFASAEGEHSGDSVAYKIKVTPDHPPVVEITEPADEFTSVPANGSLPVKGKVKDDFGIADVRLRLKMEKGAALEAKPYAAGAFRYEDKGFPTEHDYHDVLDLTTLRYEGGQTPQLKEGDIIEYWLEATDNCDFPKGQVGQSKVKKVKVLKPIDARQQKDQKDKNEQAKKQHDKNTAEQRSQENKDRQEQAKNEGSQSGEQSSSGKDNRTPEQQKRDAEAQKAADDFKKDVEKNKEKGESKPDPDNKKGEGKDQGANPESKNEQGANGNESKDGNEGKNSESKNGNEGKGGSDSKNGNEGKGGSESKSGGNNGESKPQPSTQEGKGGNEKGAGPGGEGKPEPRSGGQDAGSQHGSKSNPNNPDSSKSADNAKGSSHGASQDEKGGGKQAGEQHAAQNKPESKSGEGKGPGDRDKKGTSGEKKPGGEPKGDEKIGTGHPESKEGKAAKDDGKAATARGDTGGTPGEGKEAGKAGDQAKGKARAQAKPGQDGVTQGSGKPPTSPNQGKDAASARGDSKQDQSASKGGQPAPKTPDTKGSGNPQMDEVQKLAKDSAKGNPEEQVNAERRLQQIAKEAKDAKVREAAEKALKDPESMAGGGTEDKTGEKPMQTAGGNSGKGGKEDSTKGPMGSGQPDEKGGPKEPGQVNGKGTPTKDPGTEKSQGEGSNSQGNEPGTKNPSSTPSAGNPGNNPGGASQGGDRIGDAPPGGGTGQEPGNATPADPAHKKKAAELQLEKLVNQITPEMLKERNWTKEDLARWQAAMKDRINRDYQRDIEKSRAAAGMGSIPGGFRQGTTGTGTAQDLQNIGKTTAPPEIRTGYQEFTQELSKLKKK